MEYFYGFLYLYPVFMGLAWISGALLYYIRYEWKKPTVSSPPLLPETPEVSVLVPCFNEEKTIEETLEALAHVDYPNYNVIAINDGSTDGTRDLLNSFEERVPWLRVIHMEENSGKATALNVGFLAAKSDFLVCIDADTILDKKAVKWIMHHMLNWPRVGAVTGNPRVRNSEGSLLARIQVGEFSAIVGMIKRSQRIFGKVFSVSGVIAGFRKKAVFQAGMWDNNTVTEDIDITWKLQRHFWDIRFEPRALCYTLMPETIRGLWAQRGRWAQGGMEVIIKNFGILKSWKQRRLTLLLLDYLLSVVWTYSLFISFAIFFVEYTGKAPRSMIDRNLLSPEGGILLLIVCLIQFAVGIILDSRYEKKVGKYYYWVIWYPIFYWILAASSQATSVPKAIFRKKSGFETWDSPDRGLK